ncbi:alpha-(1-_3)-arabinofuranosyltransferase domain-containing protein [Streptacidiphilus jiangxiensis]|uniref:Arabinofuranan 3-O-arabinosyltransferase n=1 Tax=Streptacidiphilus jiangxiensis TaxID=235985 RepID=A0A1H7N665_STRJI|nr:alpha-(1->3)-arabinofuranosyltransferase family protein [Streptacidiphilus jiangxiensis]SEL18993.1 arabinofuranan 3-O-arabinosyltransferase [Streptacidiphilus jiangxiensis]
MSTAEASSQAPVASGSQRSEGADPGRGGPSWPRLRTGFVGSRAEGRAGTRWLLGVWALALLGLLLEAPGRIVFDTKIDVVLTPGRFLGQLADLWSSQGGFGGLQDQAVGYAFPMGPFYWVVEFVGVPPWIAERLWMSLIVAAAFWGAVRLAERLGVGTTASRLSAGLGYALWPTLTALLGSTSAAVLPMALLPWVVVPLVDGTRGGVSPLRCAGRSALVVLCMGGVNAVSVLAVLPAPLLYLLTRQWTARTRRLLVRWLLAVLLVTAWWWLPLLLLGRYGFDFLPYIETPHTTTSTMAATEALRGTGNWLDYLDFGTPALSAGWVLATTGWAVAGSAALAGLGLGGLARRDLPEARWLRWTLGFGAVAVLAVYGGTLGGPLHNALQSLLNGPGEAFHSVYKFQPLLALPLVLGLAHLLGRAFTAPRRILVPATAFVLTAALLGCAVPYLTARTLQNGSFTAVPDYWKQTADFLAENGGGGRSLLEPATSHGDYSWGSTTDDAFQPYAQSSWAERTLVPNGGAGVQRYLDAAEQAFATGTDQPSLAAYLARAGIRYVVLRHDLDPNQFDYTDPTAYRETLLQSGFQLAASFGPVIPPTPVRGDTPLQVAALDYGYRAVEIFEADSSKLQPGTPFGVLPATGTLRLSGGPENLLQLSGASDGSGGGLADGRAVLLSGQGARTGGSAPAGSPLVVADGLRRTDTSFGLIRDNVSYTYTADGTNPSDRGDGSGGKAPRQLQPPFDMAGHQTTAVLVGAASVSASSYGSWLLQSPQYDPVNAFDGDPATAWTEGDPNSPVGQWLRIDFDGSVDLPATISLQLLDDSGLRPLISRLTVRTDRGTTTDALGAGGTAQDLAVPAGPTHSLTLTIAAATGAVPGGLGAGISEVSIPGVQVTRYLATAHDAPTNGAGGVALSFHRTVAATGLLGPQSAETGLARQFTLDAPDTFDTTLSAMPVPGPALDGLIRGLTPRSGLSVVASPAIADLPQYQATNLVQAASFDGWIAAPGTTPQLSYSWKGARTLSELDLQTMGGLAAAPLTVQLTSPDGSRTAAVGADGKVTFAPLRTDQVTVTFPTVQRISTYEPITGTEVPLPLGLAKASFPALSDLQQKAADPTTPFDVPCGQGPDLSIDGHAYPTSASGTLGSLLSQQPVVVTLCTPGGARLALGAGTHRLDAPGDGAGQALALTDATLVGASERAALDGTATPPGSAARAVSAWSWGQEDRSVTVGTGPAAYLEVHENAAPGWTATLNGQTLQAVTLDGWQQGYLIPAGAAGVVTLHYTPQTWYRVALDLGALLLLLVVVVLVAAARRERAGAPAVGGDLDAVGPRTGLAWPVGPLVAVAVLALVGGPMAGAALVLVVLWWWRPDLARVVGPVVAVAAMTAAGVIAAVSVEQGLTPGQGAFGPAAQACALTALAAALAPWGARPTPGGAPATPLPPTATPSTAAPSSAGSTEAPTVPLPTTGPATLAEPVPGLLSHVPHQPGSPDAATQPRTSGEGASGTASQAGAPEVPE